MTENKDETTPLTDQEVSMLDEDFAKQIRDILAAKYGVIALNEPILHTAVANAAALSLVSEKIKHVMSQQRDGVVEDYQHIRDDVTNALLMFEKKLLIVVQTTTSEVCLNHIEQFRNISEKQTAQIEYLLKHGIKQVNQTSQTSTPNASPEPLVKPWFYMAIGALVGSIVSLGFIALSM
ncbi:hypothetical protein BBN09_10770 [Vibrio parahaemolyticus]|jgi:nitrate reductase NapAB chaperone NapD|uniref:hypothetical protein n=1 Tax=Vibrio parahaemolyticus TaxID=670 RepID=UPI00084AC998|nr:hypothetical protein [Vibrio parahaemolyticus]OEB90913.1 hypothetical protein BBN09_10770 [Vibrio parahaemolyticus]